MKIISSAATVINLYQLDSIPFFLLQTKNNISGIADKFSFGKTEISDGQIGTNTIKFFTGETMIGERKIPIIRLEIMNRRILLEVEGETKDAYDILDNLLGILKKESLVSEDVNLEPVVQSCETLIISKLSFHAIKLFPDKLINLINENGCIFSTSIGMAKLHLGEINFRVSYIPTDEKLVDRRIMLSDKGFSIQPRDGVPLDEQTFLSRAPLDTNSHIKLLENLESTYS